MSIAPSEFLVFCTAHDPRDGLALLFEAGEVPEIREIAALPRLDRLDRAIDPFQEDAFAIGFLREREPLPVLPQTRELRNERALTHALERRHPADFGIGNSHLTWPPATSRAPLAFVKDRHNE